MSDDQMAEILRRLTRLDDGQDKLRTDVMARMDRLQTSVDAIREALADRR